MSSTSSYVPVIVAASQASSYRVKFNKAEFIELVKVAQPKIIYRRKTNHFFAFDGFAMYCQQCSDEDFPDQKVIDTIEFSNEVWST